uniref:Uncharacterized protein n=2 Tax=Oryza TaxID=4527 RepID=A0A0D3F8N8_9ORYZ
MALCMRKGRTVQLYGPDQSTRHAPAVAWRVSAEIVVVEFNERTKRTCKQLRQTKKKDRHAGSRARTPVGSIYQVSWQMKRRYMLRQSQVSPVR